MGACVDRIVEWTGDDFSSILLHQTADHLSDRIPLQEALEEMVRFVVSVMKCDSCMSYTVEKNLLVLQATSNPPLTVVQRLKLRTIQDLAGWNATSCPAVMIQEHAGMDPRSKIFNGGSDNLESFFLFPLMSRGQLTGAVVAQSRSRKRPGERDMHLIATIGFLAANAIERARLEAHNALLVEKLDTRNIVERAKGILQRDLNISEETAYRTMQRQSQEKNKSMKEIAAAVIFSADLKDSALPSNFEGNVN